MIMEFPKRPINMYCLLCLLIVMLLPCTTRALDKADEKPKITRYQYRIPDSTVVGHAQWHVVQPRETLLDIAREYGLGFNEISLVYPNLDPWLPPPKRRVLVPTTWVLPPTRYQQLVINIPELRLYFFHKKSRTVQTYPIGIGDEGWETPLGTCRIVQKRLNPTWHIPKSLQAEYRRKSIPPGPENPLGHYFMALSIPGYGIHGTNMPWGVGRLVSHGCIRCYPEHIAVLYPQVKIGTRLEIIYEPVKLGRKNGQIYVEAHPDVYQRLKDYNDYATKKLRAAGLEEKVDMNRFLLALRLQNGVPTNVTRIKDDHQYKEPPDISDDNP